MPGLSIQIESPESDRLDELAKWLASNQGLTTKQKLQRCADDGVFRWFVPEEVGGFDYGGFGWQPNEIIDGYLKLGASCLTTTFVITQWVAAVSRILNSDNNGLKQSLLPKLLSGESHITVGISHLTTSRRHLTKPALTATRQSASSDKNEKIGFRLNGFSPWVTAAPIADYFLVGAILDDDSQDYDQQVLLVVPAHSLPAHSLPAHSPAQTNGITIEPSQSLVALNASQTGPVRFEDVHVPMENLVAGPAESVLATKKSSGTGGIQTSTLALALARAAIDYIDDQAKKRIGLSDKGLALQDQWSMVYEDLCSVANGAATCSNENLRTRANSLALRSTQAAMVAAKGAGFVEGHPVGRWCREALFFLVWSCPQTVSDANLCELAGIQS